MQKISTMQTKGKKIFQGQLTIGLDLGDRSSAYCVLNETGEIVLGKASRNPALNRRIAKMAKETYPETALLQQVKGVGDVLALAYVLTIEDPHRFRKSRDAGCFVGLQPGRRNSGESEPQMHISKEGDEYQLLTGTGLLMEGPAGNSGWSTQ